MNFLAPWFWLGGLAVAGPVVFHLIRRSVRERTEFSSALFLQTTPPRATRRRKLEHVVLLLLRCLAVLLLAAAFARPFLPRSSALPAAAEAGRQTILLVDTSASMRRAGLWPKVRGLAEHYLQAASVADNVGVMSFDRQPRTVFSLTEWSAWPADRRVALARERLDALTPGWGGTQLGLALTTAAEQFGDQGNRGGLPPGREVVLISDLQEGAALEGLQGHDWPKGVRVTVEPVEATRQGNAGLQVLEAAPDAAGQEAGVRALMVNARGSAHDRFLVGWAAETGGGFAGNTLEVYLPPGQSRTFIAPPLPAGTRTGLLRLTGDEDEFDNTAWFAAGEKEPVVVAYFGADSPNDPEHARYYLGRAFPATPHREVDVVPLSTNSALALETLKRANLIVVPGSLGPAESRAIRESIKGGQTALVVLTNAQAGPTLAALAGVARVEIKEAVSDYGLWSEIDFTHPLFAPFAEPKFSDFSRIHFWRHRQWVVPAELTARVLARFDDRAPALVQLPIGTGNLLVLAAGWHPVDSQLAVSSKFLPLMQTLLEWSGAGGARRTQFQIGDAVPAPFGAGDAVEWHKPDGKLATLPAGTAFLDTDIPGLYAASGRGRTMRFAVNVPGEESRTEALSVDDLARLGVPLQGTPITAPVKSLAAKRRFLEEEMESRQKLWRWFILGLLGLAFVEVVLGGWLARRTRPQEVMP